MPVGIPVAVTVAVAVFPTGIMLLVAKVLFIV
jgi:hypothetical protein